MELSIVDATTRRQRGRNCFGSCREKSVSCWHFIYNNNDKTFCGKTLNDWGKLI